jgi:hypothetical protein
MRNVTFPAKNVFVIDANRGTLNLYKVSKNACMISGTYHYSTGMNGSTDYTFGVGFDRPESAQRRVL